ncbi:MAG: glutathione peroxidase [Bacteroidales bacterium]|nr:glutathione peroxidase [Bacteroidales bacterium]
MKLAILIIGVIFINTSNSQTTIYDFTVNDINGKTFKFNDLKGKKIMIVNVASKCGFTPQYEQLQALYDKYKDKNFLVIGFPANNFLNQEPGTAEEIKAFCSTKYGVTFPLMEKISVKGKDMHPIYQWLTQKEKNGLIDAPVQWNFQKFLINEKGQIDQVLAPRESPMSEKVINWIEH